MKINQPQELRKYQILLQLKRGGPRIAAMWRLIEYITWRMTNKLPPKNGRGKINRGVAIGCLMSQGVTQPDALTYWNELLQSGEIKGSEDDGYYTEIGMTDSEVKTFLHECPPLGVHPVIVNSEAESKKDEWTPTGAAYKDVEDVEDEKDEEDEKDGESAFDIKNFIQLILSEYPAEQQIGKEEACQIIRRDITEYGTAMELRAAMNYHLGRIDDPKFIPHIDTFMRKWGDYVETWRVRPATGSEGDHEN